MRLRFIFADQDFTATLEDNPSARDLVAMLPLDLTISDYSSNEKIAYLPRKLTEEGSGRFGNEAVGDLCYYAQMLIITTGQGWVQEEGKERRVVNPGDVVWIPADVKHWHGATATSPMAHIALSYMQDGKNVDWLEPVSDEQYR